MYATDGHDVLCSMAHIDLTGLLPCSHEEADSRLFLHVADAVKGEWFRYQKLHLNILSHLLLLN